MAIDYKAAGVDREAGYEEVKKIKEIVKKTLNENVLSSIGGFSGLYKIPMEGMEEPVLVSGTDGVGTKLKLAFMTDIHNTVGEDLVAMCVNDILCQGATPLFFLDYIGTGKLDPDKMASIVEGVANGCEKGGCALIGGETAEMPGFYPGGEYDMAGFAVGVVDRKKIIDGSKIVEGDVVIGLPSTGIHSNGFSLVRNLVFDKMKLDINEKLEGLDKPLGEVLLTPTKIYYRSIQHINSQTDVHGYVHITGGGIYENIPRILPDGLTVRLDFSKVDRPRIFDYLQEWGDIETKEMYSTFNMGVGMIAIIDKNDLEKVEKSLKDNKEAYYILGEVIKSDGELELCL